MKQPNGINEEAAPAEDLHHVECRAWERHPCDLPSACQPIAANRGHDLSWPAKIRDLSIGGVGLVLERRFEPGVILFLELTLPGSDSPETVMAKVVYAKAIAGNRWFLGCAFCRRLNPSKIESLVETNQSQGAIPAGGHRPAFTGLTAHGTVQGETSLLPLKTIRHSGLVKTIPGEPPGVQRGEKYATRSGLFRNSKNSFLILENIILQGELQGETGCLQLARFHLWASWPLAEGTKLLLRILDPNGNPARVLIRVTTSLQDGEQWTIHYELVEPPSAEALNLLGFSST